MTRGTKGWKGAVGATPTRSCPRSPRPAPRAEGSAFGLLQPRENEPGLVEQRGPGLGQLHTARPAVEEAEAEPVLQRLDLQAEWRLRHA